MDVSLPSPHTISLFDQYQNVRKQTEALCEPLEIEDYVVQPITDVSPPKWHLAHTTWFFEIFVLKNFDPTYKLFHEDYPFLFNSYYISAGERWNRSFRGDLSRPTVKQIYDYRHYVDESIKTFLSSAEITEEIKHVLEVGLHHEQQHQELLIYDIKYILGNNPLYPVYKQTSEILDNKQKTDSHWLNMKEGLYDIGFRGQGYHFDNELGLHQQFLEENEISSSLVTNGEYLEFVEAGGYENHQYWLSEGWDWVNTEQIKHPLYWIKGEKAFQYFTLHGVQDLEPDAPVSHISFYEADAFAKWKGVRLPTEFEWEAAARLFAPELSPKDHFVEAGHFEAGQTGGYDFLGNLWEWTASSYRPYPRYKAPAGALGEYNGKFMANQMVLRGGSYATPSNHIRHSYRNFFHPHLRWMCSGIRLAKCN